MSAEWISVTEAAHRLGADRHTLYDGAAHGEIPARRIGRSVRVPAWWVDAGGPDGNGHHTTPDAEQFAAEVTARVLAALAEAFTSAARGTAPVAHTEAVLDFARDDEGRHERTRAT